MKKFLTSLMIAFILTGSVGGLIVPREINAVTSPPTLNIQEQVLLQEIKQSRAFLTNQVRGETLNVEKIKILSETHGERGTYLDRNTISALPNQLAKQISDRGDSDAALQKALAITNQTERTDALKKVLAGQQEDLKDINGYLKQSGPAYTNILKEYTTEEKSILASTASRERVQQTSTNAQTGKARVCFDMWGSGLDLEICLQHAVAWLGELSLKLTSLLVFIGGSVMDIGIAFSIENFSKIAKDPSITQAWGVLRDFANMFFIFMLLYAAISTVLGKDTKKVVIGVITAALVINFSFFITSIFIDISNTLTVGLYNLATGGSTSISTSVMSSLGLSDIFSSAGLENKVGTEGALINIATIGFMGSIFLVVTAFVFFAAGILFILRGVTFLILLILSPLAFAASGLPRDEISGQWWGALISNIIFAPMYMIMIFMSLKVASGLTRMGLGEVAGGEEAQTLAAAFTAPGSGVPVINFIVIIVLMIASLVIAKNLGAAGASRAVSMGKKWSGNLRTGLQGYAGRGAVRMSGLGRLDKSIEDYSSKSGVRGSVARFLTTTRTGQSIRGATTGAAVGAKFGSGRSVIDVNKATKDTKKIRQDYERTAEDKAVIEAGIAASKVNISSRTPVQTAAIHGMEMKLSQMSNKDLETLGKDTLKDPVVVAALTPNQLEHLASDKNEKLSDGDKDKLKTERFKKVKTIAEKDPAAITQEDKDFIRGISVKEFELDPSMLDNPNVIDNLSTSQLEGINKSYSIGRTQRKAIQDQKLAPITKGLATARATPVAARTPEQIAEINNAVNAFKKMPPKEKARLDINTLTLPEIMTAYTQQILIKMAPDMLDTTQVALKDAIIAYAESLTGVGRPLTPEEDSVANTANWIERNPDKF